METRNVKQVKKSWTLIDEHVRNTSEVDEKTFQKLIDYFDQPIKTRLNRDTYMTREIIYWIFTCENRKSIKAPSKDSPLSLIEQLRKRTMSRQDVFKRLCDKGGVTCEIVKGIAKSSGFEPGQKDTSKLKTSWNKVKLEGLWWPVFPDWIVQSAGKDGKVVHQFTEFWFLTPPEIFILKCYPDDVSDQMLPPSNQIKTERKFLKLPALSFHFFDYNLTLASEESSLLDTDDGKCSISFKTDSATAKRLAFYPRLTMPKGSGDDYDINRLVCCSRRKGRFTFEVRCPVKGEYVIQIRGGPIEKLHEGDKPFYTAKIDCFELPVDSASLLPIDTGITGWGFGPAAEEKGLLKPTMKDPKIYVKAKKITFGFTLNPDVAKQYTYNAVLHGGAPSYDFKADVDGKRSSNKITFDVQVRNAGEYGFAIYASKDKDGRNKEMICAYLINSKEDPNDDFSDDSIEDGLSDLDEENYQLEQEVADLEARYAEMLERAQTAKGARTRGRQGP